MYITFHFSTFQLGSNLSWKSFWWVRFQCEIQSAETSAKNHVSFFPPKMLGLGECCGDMTCLYFGVLWGRLWISKKLPSKMCPVVYGYCFRKSFLEGSPNCSGYLYYYVCIFVKEMLLLLSRFFRGFPQLVLHMFSSWLLSSNCSS